MYQRSSYRYHVGDRASLSAIVLSLFCQRSSHRYNDDDDDRDGDDKYQVDALREEQYWSEQFAHWSEQCESRWAIRGPRGPPPKDAPETHIARPVNYPGPPAERTSRTGQGRARADELVGRAYSTEQGGRLTWRNQRWRANSQKWANSGGRYKEWYN